MPSISQLHSEEATCHSRIAELQRVLDDLANFQAEVTLSSNHFHDQLDHKISIAKSAADLLDNRTARRYAEYTAGYLNNDLKTAMSHEFNEVNLQIKSAVNKAEQELKREQAQLACIKHQVAAEQARLRAERARQEAEAEARRHRIQLQS